MKLGGTVASPTRKLCIGPWLKKKVVCGGVALGEDNLELISRGMDRYNLRHLPVVSDEKLVGLITHRDLLRIAVSSLVVETPSGKALQEKLDQTTFVAEVMTPDPVTVSPTTTIAEALELLISNKYGCLPVLDEEEKLVGIVTEFDFLKFLKENYNNKYKSYLEILAKRVKKDKELMKDLKKLKSGI